MLKAGQEVLVRARVACDPDLMPRLPAGYVILVRPMSWDAMSSAAIAVLSADIELKPPSPLEIMPRIDP